MLYNKILYIIQVVDHQGTKLFLGLFWPVILKTAYRLIYVLCINEEFIATPQSLLCWAWCIVGGSNEVRAYINSSHIVHVHNNTKHVRLLSKIALWLWRTCNIEILLNQWKLKKKCCTDIVLHSLVGLIVLYKSLGSWYILNVCDTSAHICQSGNLNHQPLNQTITFSNLKASWFVR